MQELGESSALIAVVDDDASVRRGLERLIRSVGWKVEGFASAQEFLERRRDSFSCLVVDLQLPDLSGLDLQKRLAEIESDTPIVFLTGHGDIPATVQAIQAGAVEFLTKPVEEENLIRAIEAAVERDRRTRQQNAELRELRGRYESLTAREQGDPAACDLRCTE